MKFFAVHDHSGTISGLVTAPDDAPSVRLEPGDGHLFSAIDVPSELLVGDFDDDFVARLAEAMGGDRVEIDTSPVPLLRHRHGG